MDHPSVSIILPTLREAGNLPLIVPRIAQAMGERSYEIIVVDDNSVDDTPRVCSELAGIYPLRLFVRTETHDGLSGAVLHGLNQARGDTFVVMDADLQHPPERIPDFLDVLNRGETDFVIGSRYAPGGSTEKRWGLFRRINSSIATLLARPFAGKVCDSMSGFFALKRQTYQRAAQLTPLGYKIALELMCKCRVQRIREIPIHFGLRVSGRSKLTIRQQFRYLEHLSRLYDFCFPRLSPAVKFLIATACGWFVGFGFYLMMLFHEFHLHGAVILAYPSVIGVITIFHLRYVRAQREFLTDAAPWRDFAFISLAEWFSCAASAWLMVTYLGRVSAPMMFVIPLTIATIARCALRVEFLHDIRGLRRRVRLEPAT